MWLSKRPRQLRESSSPDFAHRQELPSSLTIKAPGDLVTDADFSADRAIADVLKHGR